MKHLTLDAPSGATRPCRRRPSWARGDVWTHEQQWTANPGEVMWAQGSALWVLDRTAVGPDCGGLVGYSLESGDSVCLPGSLEYLSVDEVVTADNGTWQAWPADPWG